MRNFLKIASNVQTTPLLLALARQPLLWNEHTLRTQYPGTPHSEVDDIWLRFQTLPEPGREVEVVDQHESVWYPAINALPEVRPLVFNLMAAVQGERLGRVMVTRLRAGGRIYPHTDDGAHAEYYERFHIVLASGQGCKFRAGDEIVHMAAGEVWWFQNALEHEVINDSKDERLHLIVDIRCPQSRQSPGNGGA